MTLWGVNPSINRNSVMPCSPPVSVTNWGNSILTKEQKNWLKLEQNRPKIWTTKTKVGHKCKSNEKKILMMKAILHVNQQY